MRPQPLAALLALLLAGMAGCAAKEPDSGGSATAHAVSGAAGQAHGLWNYTTPDPGGPRSVRDYAGSLTPQEVSGAGGGLPLGLSPAQFPTCCYLDWVDTPDLLAIDQLVALRVTVNWTNTQADHAGLDAAACVPWRCQAFNVGPDESLAEGAHSDTLTLITSGRQDFLDAGAAVQLGVRYTNAVLTSGLPYTIHAELAPVGNGLALQDPYLVHVALNATVVAELVGAYAPDGISAGLMVYGADDRPREWVTLAGSDGDRFNLTLPAGASVVVPFDYTGGFVRLSTDRQPPMPMLHRLKVETGQKDLAEVPDTQEHSGDVAYAAPPGSMGDFPFFLYGDGAAAQNLLGLEPQKVGGANVTMASSNGLIAALDQTLLGVSTSVTGRTCLDCFGNGRWHPENYLDDDGTYQLHWSSSGAAGKFVLFTQKYVR
jgi:hypothetical protein